MTGTETGFRIGLVWFAALLLVGGCARRPALLELSGSVMYAKPEIREVSHELSDSRPEGGTVAVRVTILGDPGLRASFDVSPDIADGVPMSETEAGRYVGEHAFPRDLVGGPFSIVGRLVHAEAGEVTRRASEPITIPLEAEPDL